MALMQPPRPRAGAAPPDDDGPGAVSVGEPAGVAGGSGSGVDGEVADGSVGSGADEMPSEGSGEGGGVVGSVTGIPSRKSKPKL